jgi:alkylation response protein AidB-like acyl-CoA dehydrogenase
MMIADATTSLLTQEMLQRFDERAPMYDRENRFFAEDFAELRSSEYLTAPLPRELGGAGLNLTEVNALQRRLAYHAPATALGVNMHLYWVGLAADLRRIGDPTGEWILARAAEGAILAAGHGEAGNDVPLMLSSAQAVRVDGGWEVTGHKIFGSLSPVWDYLGIHAAASSSCSGTPASVASTPATRC